FQLIYLAFTRPRADVAAVADVASLFETGETDVYGIYLFGDVWLAAITQDHPRGRRLTAEMVRQIDIEKALAFYKDRLPGPPNITFVFVGSFAVPTLQPLVERYLGGLPSLYRHETWKDVGMTAPPGVVEKVVEKGRARDSEGAR